MEITSVQYTQEPENPGVNACIKMVKADGSTWYVPIKAGNTDYAEIMQQVAAGTLTIADADD